MEYLKSAGSFITALIAAVIFMFVTFETRANNEVLNSNIKELFFNQMKAVENRLDRIETKIDVLLGGKIK